MAHFAKLDSDNKVIHVSVVNNSDILDESGNESEQVGIEYLTKVHGYSKWKQTSYNNNLRKKYAGIGDTYDPDKDAFIPYKPHPTWVLNEETWQWEAPVPYPSTDPEDSVHYYWNEETEAWEHLPSA